MRIRVTVRSPARRFTDVDDHEAHRYSGGFLRHIAARPQEPSLNRFICGLLTLLCVLLAAAAQSESDSDADSGLSIGVALGSGGAGGLAHIAMLQVFDDKGIKPDEIAGTSIGAVIGVMYAAGLSAAEIRDIFDDFSGSNLDALSKLMKRNSELRLRDLLRLDFDNGGVFDAGGFIDFITGKFEAETFEELKIPLLVVATDYWTGEAVVLAEGDLAAAIKASMAVPGLFAPVKMDDKLLLDGGMSNPLPYDLLADDHDLIVAVDVSSTRSAGEDDEPEVLDLLFSTFEIMQQSIIAARMQSEEPDIYVKPDTSDIRLLHFNRIEKILEKAEPAAQKFADELDAYLER